MHAVCDCGEETSASSYKGINQYPPTASRYLDYPICQLSGKLIRDAMLHRSVTHGAQILPKVAEVYSLCFYDR